MRFFAEPQAEACSAVCGAEDLFGGGGDAHTKKMAERPLINDQQAGKEQRATITNVPC